MLQKRTSILTLLSMTFVFFVAFAISARISTSTLAQTFPLAPVEGATLAITLEPDGPSISEVPQSAIDARATNEADIATRSIFDYHIAYLIAEDAVGKSQLFLPVNFERVAGSITIYTWEDFLKLNEEKPFDIVLLHGSMFGQIDSQWVQKAYRTGTMFIGFGMTHEQLSELTGDACLKNPNPQIDYSGDAFVYPSYHVELSDESYRETVDHALLVECSEEALPSDIRISIYHGSTQFQFDPNTDVEANLAFLVQLMVVETKDYGKPNQHTGE